MADTTVTAPTTDTVDITDLVEKTRSAFVDWAVAYTYGLLVAMPNIGPIFAFPVISSIVKFGIKSVLDIVSKSAVMEAFFMNTILRKATQADDFVKATNALANLPDNVSDADYEAAEQAKMQAFRNFVVLTN